MQLLMSLSNLARLCLSEWISFLLVAVPLDHLLQADRARQRAHRAPGPRAVSSGAVGATLRRADLGPRRYAGPAFLGVGAQLLISPRPQSQDQPATVPACAVLGHRRVERARPWRSQPGAADSLPPGADDRQPRQARDCAGAAARTGRGGRQAGAGAVRFLVYARWSGVAFDFPLHSVGWLCRSIRTGHTHCGDSHALSNSFRGLDLS